MFHTYGDLSSGQLLQLYGFVQWQEADLTPIVNPSDFVLVPWTSICQAMRMSQQQGVAGQLDVLERRTQFLAHMGVLPANLPSRDVACCVLTQDNLFPNNLLVMLQVRQGLSFPLSSGQQKVQKAKPNHSRGNELINW